MEDKYISWNEESFRVRITVHGDFENRYDPQVILNNLIDKSDDIERKESTDRVMWPEKELMGIKFDLTGRKFKGSITRDSISLTSGNINNIDELYSTVYKWTKNTSIHLPPLTDFYLSGYSLDVIPRDDNTAIVFDSTKRNTNDVFGSLHSYNCDGYISGIQNVCSVYFDDEVDIDSGKKYIKECIDDELFVITDRIENEEFLDKISE